MNDRATYAGPFRVLITRESGMTVVQCVDFDIVSQGRDEHHALERFWKTTAATIMCDLDAAKTPLERCPPKETLTRWEQIRSRTVV